MEGFNRGIDRKLNYLRSSYRRQCNPCTGEVTTVKCSLHHQSGAYKHTVLKGGSYHVDSYTIAVYSDYVLCTICPIAPFYCDSVICWKCLKSIKHGMYSHTYQLIKVPSDELDQLVDYIKKDLIILLKSKGDFQLTRLKKLIIFIVTAVKIQAMKSTFQSLQVV